MAAHCADLSSPRKRNRIDWECSFVQNVLLDCRESRLRQSEAKVILADEFGCTVSKAQLSRRVSGKVRGNRALGRPVKPIIVDLEQTVESVEEQFADSNDPAETFSADYNNRINGNQSLVSLRCPAVETNDASTSTLSSPSVDPLSILSASSIEKAFCNLSVPGRIIPALNMAKSGAQTLLTIAAEGNTVRQYGLSMTTEMGMYYRCSMCDIIYRRIKATDPKAAQSCPRARLRYYTPEGMGDTQPQHHRDCKPVPFKKALAKQVERELNKLLAEKNLN